MSLIYEQAGIFMVQTAPHTAKAARRKLLLQIVTFLAIVLLVVLQPRIEAWVRSQNTDVTSNDEKTGPESEATSQSPPSSGTGHDNPGTRNTETRNTETGNAETADAASDRGDAESGDSPVASDDQKLTPGLQSGRSGADETAAAGQNSSVGKDATTAKDKTSQKSQKTSEKKSDIVRMERPQTKSREISGDTERSNPPPASSKERAANSEPGKLREIENNVFQSTAGLIYLPGSADGHRLRHVMQHAKDNPQKEVHGVFDGDRDEILAVIDEAWMKVQKGGSDVRSQKQNDRRVVTVNLKRRIGHVGGRQGERQGNPECRYLRIVLENENEVVTAYPTKSF